MSCELNESRRHKILGTRHRVTNWPEYDVSLVQRGSITVSFTEEAVVAWHAPATGARGGQPIYSAVAIETGRALRLVFHQPLRQTEGLLRSIADVLESISPFRITPPSAVAPAVAEASSRYGCWHT
jgi:Transposase DDE domain